MATDRVRFTVSLEPDFYKKIEDYRFDARYTTMSRAIENLIKRGLSTYYGECANVKVGE